MEEDEKKLDDESFIGDKDYKDLEDEEGYSYGE